jgi:two-component system response regulator AtoC
MTWKNASTETLKGTSILQKPVSTIIGESGSMMWLKTLVLKVAPLNTHVVIIGPSGSGKNLVADEIQHRSLRSGDPYIKIGCIGVPEHFLYRDIFGAEINEVEQTASDTKGKLELANNGTFLLDEIGELPQKIQARLVNALEGENSNQCTVGKSRNSNFRIIATSRLDIPSLVEENKFREDLYFRLSRIVIHIPPLRQRLEDLPLLVDFFLPRVNQKLGTAIMAVSNDAMGLLYSYQWPGNVRELGTILERAALFEDSKILQEGQIEKALHASVPRWHRGLDFIDERNPISTDRIHLRQTLQAVEKRLIERALLKTRGVQTQAAKLLGLTAKNLWKKMQKYEIRSSKLVDFPPTKSRMPVETGSWRSTTFQAEIEPDANTSR